MTTHTKKTGFARLFSAAHNSIKGLVAVYQTEAAFRQELLVLVPFMLLAFFVGENATQIALLVSVCVLILLTEIINSAIEAVVDRIGTDYHELSGKAKDLGSLAVMVSIILAAIVWGIILFNHT